MASLAYLLFQAGEDRRARLAEPRRTDFDPTVASDGCTPEFAASVVLEEVLTGDLGTIVNCATYLTRVVTLQHMAIPSLNVLMTSIAAVKLPPVVGRGLAVALCEVMRFVGDGATAGGSVELRLAVGMDGRDLVVGLAASEDIQPVATASATAALIRAAAVVRALRGEFVRAYEPATMTFGIVLPRPYIEILAEHGFADRWLP